MATVESEAANGTLEAPDTGSSSTESPTQGVPLTVKIVQGRCFPPIGIFKRQGRFFVEITVDKNKTITATSARSNDPLWGEPLEGL
ncbi:hypothetical protein OF83DRAFT_1177428 [Amylostereum chailletii]|nr:hypothetical protein OF83DRAFT_1177428 [Amylostereum chailletii]